MYKNTYVVIRSEISFERLVSPVGSQRGAEIGPMVGDAYMRRIFECMHRLLGVSISSEERSPYGGVATKHAKRSLHSDASIAPCPLSYRKLMALEAGALLCISAIPIVSIRSGVAPWQELSPGQQSIDVLDG